MSKIIFSPSKLETIWSFLQKSQEKKFNDDPKLLYYIITLDDLKSFQSAPSGMKWSAEEKASFEKLNYVEKKKYLIITDSSKRVDLKTLNDELSCRKLEFVSPSVMEKLINATPGNVSIFNMMYDYNKEIELIIDEELLEVDYIAFHPLYNGMSIFLPPKECFKFLDSIGRDAKVMAIPVKKEEKVLIKNN